MADLTIQRGDHGFYLQGTMTNNDGSVFNLTGYTLSIIAWELGNWAHPIIEATASVVVATQGTWKYLVQASDFITPGDFLAVLCATSTAAEEKTLSHTIEVKEAP